MVYLRGTRRKTQLLGAIRTNLFVRLIETAAVTEPRTQIRGRGSYDDRTCGGFEYDTIEFRLPVRNAMLTRQKSLLKLITAAGILRSEGLEPSRPSCS